MMSKSLGTAGIEGIVGKQTWNEFISSDLGIGEQKSLFERE